AFFRALQQGAALGEAFLHSSPYVDWKLILVGDQLMVVNFTSDVLLTPSIPSDGLNSPFFSPSIITNSPLTVDATQALIYVKDQIEHSLAYALRQSKLTQELVNHVLAINDLAEGAKLLQPSALWRDYTSEVNQKTLFTPLVISWVNS